MPILLILMLTAACAPVEWPASPFGFGPGRSAALTGATVLLSLAAAFAVRTWAVRALARWPEDRVRVGRAYARLRYALFFVNLALFGFAVVGLGWGATVWDVLAVPYQGRRVLAPFAELAVPLPYFLVVFGCWLVYFDADRALHRAGLFGAVRGYWSRGGYFVHHLRQLALLVALPVGLYVGLQSLTRFAPATARADWFKVASLAVVPLVVPLLPLFVKPVLGLVPLPPGPARDRIAALARRLGFRYTDLLMWPTHSSVANAMIVGVVPRARYVIFTDRILEELPDDEVDAVFGHEVGHARHGHLWFYLVFFTLSMVVLAALLLLAATHLDALAAANPQGWYARLAAEDGWWLALPPFGLFVGYLFVAFGFLSRRCERQADVFGCRAVSCANPDCTGHDEATVYPPGGAGLCATGIRTCARALERVYHVNGHDDPPTGAGALRGLLHEAVKWVRAWQHAPMPRRVAFLLSLIDDRTRERRFQRRVLALRWGLALGLAAALVVLGEVVGWRELLKVM